MGIPITYIKKIEKRIKDDIIDVGETEEQLGKLPGRVLVGVRQ